MFPFKNLEKKQNGNIDLYLAISAQGLICESNDEKHNKIKCNASKDEILSGKKNQE